ncbi:MAG: protein kinase domain-containing protein, partial [Polyangiaceae bacterium]
MNRTIDILRTELERLYSLEEMTAMSRRLLGIEPEDIGGAAAKATFARALAARCVDGDQVDALVDAVLASRQGVDPRLEDALRAGDREELPAGRGLGEFFIARKLGEGPSSIVYAAGRGDSKRVLKVLSREASRDKRAVQRFLTATRLASAVDHPGLPAALEAGESGGVYYTSYALREGQPLSARLSRTGAIRFPEAKAILIGILEALAALHRARIAHGSIKPENVLVVARPRAKTLLGIEDADETTVVEDVRESGRSEVLLIDAGTDRLRQRATAANGHSGWLAVIGSP